MHNSFSLVQELNWIAKDYDCLKRVMHPFTQIIWIGFELDMHVRVESFFICKRNCVRRGSFNRISTCNVIAGGDVTISWQSGKGQKALAISQEIKRDEVSQTLKIVGIFVCMCALLTLFDVGRCIHEQIINARLSWRHQHCLWKKKYICADARFNGIYFIIFRFKVWKKLSF
jgi:hypothetical protein